jgi:hypothetical protein
MADSFTILIRSAQISVPADCMHPDLALYRDFDDYPGRAGTRVAIPSRAKGGQG